MKVKRKLALFCGTVLLSAGILTPAHADSPGKPASTPGQEYSISGFISHDELVNQMKYADVEVAGYSNHGREIYKVTVGTGNKVVLIQSEIHGNEKVEDAPAA